jgi:hypothetical protein
MHTKKRIMEQTQQLTFYLCLKNTNSKAVVSKQMHEATRSMKRPRQALECIKASNQPVWIFLMRGIEIH